MPIEVERRGIAGLSRIQAASALLFHGAAHGERSAHLGERGTHGLVFRARCDAGLQLGSGRLELAHGMQCVAPNDVRFREVRSRLERLLQPTLGLGGAAHRVAELAKVVLGGGVRRLERERLLIGRLRRHRVAPALEGDAEIEIGAGKPRRKPRCLAIEVARSREIPGRLRRVALGDQIAWRLPRQPAEHRVDFTKIAQERRIWAVCTAGL